MHKINHLPVLVLFLLVIAGCTEKEDKTPRHPNVLFILADDLGIHDLSVTGSVYYETPNIDRIAKEGMIFDQGYAASRVCSPSRASIMTGKFTARHGITDWIGAKTGVAWREHQRFDQLLPATYVGSLPKNDIVLPEALKAAGYQTFFAGKWHLGNQGSWPEDHGFDSNRGGWEKGSPIGGYFSPWNNPNLENVTEGENLSMRLAKETSRFMERNKDSTFFAMLSFYAVHGPIQTTQAKWAKYREKAVQAGLERDGYEMERNLPIRKVQDNPVYAGLVESMDDAVGLVLNTLEQLGIDENTMVIFTSDNGGVASGDAFSTSNLPLRGGKGYQWEGGIREPYFIKVPWMAHKGKHFDYPVSGTDFYPTILDLAGLEPLPDQHMDGLSLKPLMEGKTMPERPLYWHYPHYGNQGGDPSSIIRLGPWKLIHYWEDDTDELYNLASDSGEKKNVQGVYPDITKDLSDQLASWLKEMGAATPVKDPDYDPGMDQDRDRRIRNELWPKLEKERINFLSESFEPNEDWWGSRTTKD